MKKNFKNLYTIGAIALLFGAAVACSEEEPLNMAPTLNMNEVTNIMRTSVTFNGSITGKTSSIKDFGFQYSLSEDFTANLTKNVSIGDTLSSSMCQTTVIGLEAAERYYYRMYASTGATTVYSNSEYFQTQSSSAPVFSALQIDSIGENNARFRCTIEDVGDEYLIEYGVRYMSSADKAWIPVPSDSIIPVSISGAQNTFYLEISGLTPATKYSFSPYAKNSSTADSSTGTREGYGSTIQVQTESLLSAEVQTLEIEDGHIGINSIDVSGSVLSAVGSKGVIDKVGFCWSETNRTPVITDNSAEFDPVKVGESFKMTIFDLKPNTEYYVRAWAKNTVNGETRVGYGETRTVSTINLKTPQIEWNEGADNEGFWYSAAEATANTIKMKAIIKNYDENAIIEKGLVWSKTSGSISLDKAKENGTVLSIDIAIGGKEINATIQDLDISTRYYIRAYAIFKAAGMEEIGYTNSYEVSTRDFEAPRLSYAEVKDITLNGATLIGGMSSEGNAPIIKKGFCLIKSDTGNSTPELTTNDAIIVESDDESFTESVENLSTATGYYVRTFAITEIGERKDTTYTWGARHFTTASPKSYTFNDIVIKSDSTTMSSLYYTCGINEEGDGEVLEKGFIWKQRPKDNWNWQNPSFEDDENYADDGNDGYIVVDDGSLDEFSARLTGLKPSTNYYVRAYVKVKFEQSEFVYYSNTNQDGTSYFPVNMNFTVYADSCYITGTVAVTDLPEGVDEIGLCYSSDTNQSVDDMENTAKAVMADDFKESGSFTVSLSNLQQFIQYKVGFYYKLNGKDIRVDNGWYFTTRREPTINDNVSPGKKDE